MSSHNIYTWYSTPWPSDSSSSPMHSPMMTVCKVKRQYLPTCKVSRYCLLALRGSMMTVWIKPRNQHDLSRWLRKHYALVWRHRRTPITSIARSKRRPNSVSMTRQCRRRWPAIRSYRDRRSNCECQLPAFFATYVPVFLNDFRESYFDFTPTQIMQLYSENMRRWSNVGFMLAQRLRRWPNIKPTMVKRVVFLLGTLCGNKCV